MEYIKPLDGLRALAAIAVLLAHSEFHFPRSGGVAVDLFFVLSGFLITNLIVRDLRRGEFSISQFYIKRMLRLFPALLLTCVLVAALQFAGVIPQNLPSIALALTYTVNWAIALFQVPCGSLSHCWSLANEEQYYLVWPLCILALERLRNRESLNVALLASGALGMAVYRAFMVGTHDSARINFGLDTRLDGLILGSGLAYAYRCSSLDTGISKFLGWILSPVSTLVLLWIMFRWHWTEPAMGQIGFLLVSICATIVIADLVMGRHSLLKKPLSIGALCYLGRISYGIYLFHLPLFHLIDFCLPNEWLPRRVLIKIVCSVAMASLSYHFVESYFLKVKQRLHVHKRVNLDDASNSASTPEKAMGA
jgi:peptidoglycan/LPS O-acetylase OafA/YrhL